MKIIQRARFEWKEKITRTGEDNANRAAAIIEVNGTRFFSVVPRDDTERDIINSALDYFVNL